MTSLGKQESSQQDMQVSYFEEYVYAIGKEKLPFQTEE